MSVLCEDKALELFQVALSKVSPAHPKGKVTRTLYIVAEDEDHAVFQLSELFDKTEITVTANGDVLAGFGKISLDKVLH